MSLCSDDALTPHPSLVKIPSHLVDVLHLRRRGETVADQIAPFGEIRGAAEIHGTVLHRLPFDKQSVACRLGVIAESPSCLAYLAGHRPQTPIVATGGLWGSCPPTWTPLLRTPIRLTPN